MQARILIRKGWRVQSPSAQSHVLDEQWKLRLGLQKLMADRNALSVALITPFDPFRRLREKQKLVYLLCLKAHLRVCRLSYIDAIGISWHASTNARGDAGVLILGMEKEVAKSLSRHYEQHVFVWAASDGVPELVQPLS